jgi:3-deoxy-D-manno-octulosonic-acid transferase
MTTMIIKLYDLLSSIGSICAVPGFLLSERGRVRLQERFGRWNLDSGRVVWCHGASAGEVRGLIPLLPSLKKKYPQAKILLTVTSPTGLTAAGEHFDEAKILPFDSTLWIKRALKGVQVECLVIGETELWPVLLNEITSRSIPIFLVNARISDLTRTRYQKLRRLFSPSLAQVKAVAVADTVSLDRFAELGVLRSRLHVTGNAKYDTKPKIKDQQESQSLHKCFWNDDYPVLVLGSIRPGEEEFWFTSIKEHFERGETFRVIVAPRHKEKFLYFAERLEEFGLSFEKWSVLKESSQYSGAKAPVVLLDTFGDLEGAYSFATVAFIGATMINIGGHNPLEASAYRVPVAMGRYSHVVQEVAADLESAGALFRIETKTDIDNVLNMLLHNEFDLRRRGEAGYLVWQKHAGAAQRIAKVLELPAVQVGNSA